jgi:ABC-type uncharacterized transport system involved in gliding motility auxiliary subunit
MMSRRNYVWTSLALAAILFVGLNVFVDNFFTDTRLDLTQARQYTLSQGTRNIIAKLPEPVTLRFYFSEKNSANYPVTAAYAKRVRDLLSEYSSLSNGKILVEDVDPEAFTPEEDEANAAGIRSAPTGNGDVFYFGLEGINSIDGQETIPYLAIEREPYLEYDITSLLYQLAHPDKPKLAILGTLPLTSNPEATDPGTPLTIYTQLRQNYDTTTLAADFSAIPASTNLLLIVHPENVTLNQQRTIASYLLHGGKALIFVDPLSELVKAEPNNAQNTPQSSDLPDLLKGFGVDYSPDMVVLDRQLAQRIRAGDQDQTVVYPVWLHLTTQYFAPRDPVTASLTSLNLASTGALSQTKGATTNFEPLVISSNQASLSDRDSVVAGMNDPASLLDQTSVNNAKTYTLAARVTGHASVAGLGAGNINMIVMADTDIFDDRFWVRLGDTPQPFADNAAFVLGAVENLTGSDDLISLRTRGNTERPFTVVEQMQIAAELKFRETLTVLQAKLSASENEMSQLQGGGNGSATTLTPAQNADIERVRRDIAGTRLQLRDVQRSLRTDIDRLGTVLAFINILLMPVLVALFAIVFGLIRRRRAQAGSRAAIQTKAGAA